MEHTGCESLYQTSIFSPEIEKPAPGRQAGILVGLGRHTRQDGAPPRGGGAAAPRTLARTPCLGGIPALRGHACSCARPDARGREACGLHSEQLANGLLRHERRVGRAVARHGNPVRIEEELFVVPGDVAAAAVGEARGRAL